MVELNDAAVLDQVREHWQSVAALLVWKLAPNGVLLTADDFVQFMAQDKVLLTHGHRESFELRIVTHAEAQLIAAHDRATNRGRA